MMKPMELVAQAKDAITVRRVFGDPVERNGITVIPAAAVQGGAGGGGGQDAQGSGGGGTGFGLTARPVGAFVIKNGEARWEPAFDLNRAILMGQVGFIVAVLAWRSVARARMKARRAEARE
ncbi:MAG TPA: spore germination protein GerW family protein [Actinomycetota bacterium]